MAASIGAVLDQLPNLDIYIEAVHRLTDLGAVIAHVAHGVSQEGFDAEWRMLFIYMVDGDLINRFELFDEADIDAAIARFDELNGQRRGWKTRQRGVLERLEACFAARDWAAIAAILADEYLRGRSPAGRELRDPPGRDAEIASVQAIAEVGTQKITSTVTATRGGRLALCRTRLSGREPAARSVPHRRTHRPRDRRGQPDRGAHRVRPRRHRFRLRSA